jgi:hypothetical protein
VFDRLRLQAEKSYAVLSRRATVKRVTFIFAAILGSARDAGRDSETEGGGELAIRFREGHRLHRVQ